jgi:hypothetical protein
MTANISLSPDPPVHDQQVLICANGATYPLKITITLSDGRVATIQIVKGCEYWTVPKNAAGLWINFHDESGQAPDESRQVV